MRHLELNQSAWNAGYTTTCKELYLRDISYRRKILKRYGRMVNKLLQMGLYREANECILSAQEVRRNMLNKINHHNKIVYRNGVVIGEIDRETKQYYRINRG